MALTIESISLADYIIEATDGKKSLVGMFDKIFVPQLPARQAHMWLHLTLRGDEVKNEKILLTAHGSDNQEIIHFELEFSINQSKKATLMIHLEQFPLTQTGEHHIHIKHKDQDLGYFLFEVVKVKKDDKEKVIN